MKKIKENSFGTNLLLIGHTISFFISRAFLGYVASSSNKNEPRVVGQSFQ